MRLLLLVAVLAAGCKHSGTTTFPTCGDNIVNQDETDVDCGGQLCTPCNTGKRCKVAKDCRSTVCTAGVCGAPTCADGLKNGSESDVDCGGPDCPPCGDGSLCSGFNDCRSKVCTGLRCQPATCQDGFQNGDELGIDCGGSCPPCDASTTPTD
jgi:hypothetical protein